MNIHQKFGRFWFISSILLNWFDQKCLNEGANASVSICITLQSLSNLLILGKTFASIIFIDSLGAVGALVIVIKTLVRILTFLIERMYACRCLCSKCETKHRVDFVYARNASDFVIFHLFKLMPSRSFLQFTISCSKKTGAHADFYKVWSPDSMDAFYAHDAVKLTLK